MLVEDTLRIFVEYLTVAWIEEMADHRAQTYHSLVLRGNLRTAVQWITEQETGRVLQLGDQCIKTVYRVMEVLRTKHPKAWTPTAASLDLYPEHPWELTPVDIINDTVTAVTGRLSREAGPDGTNLVLLQHWLVRFRAASGEHWLIIGDFVEWLGNGRLPWAAYR